MPYRVGIKGSTPGCGGYPVIEEGGKVVGCHATRAQADEHIQALYANVPDASKSEVAGANSSFAIEPKYPGAGVKRPEQGKGGKGVTGSSIKSKYGKKPKDTRRGRSGDARDGAAPGAIGAGGTSMGAL